MQLPLFAKYALLAAGIFLLGRAGAQQEELRLVGAETTFYCYRSPAGDGAVSGLACDLMREMARRVGHSGKIQLVPLARALTVASTSRGVLLAPVARIAAREQRFGWQVPIFEDDFVVVTRRDSPVDISSIDALRKLQVGMVRDSAGARLSEQVGLTNVRLVPNDDANLRILNAGRVDAWLSSWNGIRAAQRDAGMADNALRRGVVLQRVTVYMASSPDVDAAQAAPWKAAMDDMLRDGSYDKILRKYRFELPR